MAENSKIAWTTHTFNPWIGCTRVSPGCQNCYAENLMDRRWQQVEWGRGNQRLRTKTWNDPIKWNKQAEKTGVRPKVFCASLADWLDDEVPESWRVELIDLIESCPNLDWLMLTKRIEKAARLLPFRWRIAPPSWVWMGVTAENQEYWNDRVGILLQTAAAIRWVSYEPALGPLTDLHLATAVDWIIVGGESSQMDPAREFKLEWADDLIAQATMLRNSPAIFVKQLGSNVTYKGSKVHLSHGAGADPSEWPAHLRVRDFPNANQLLPTR